MSGGPDRGVALRRRPRRRSDRGLAVGARHPPRCLEGRPVLARPGDHRPRRRAGRPRARPLGDRRRRGDGSPAGGAPTPPLDGRGARALRERIVGHTQRAPHLRRRDRSLRLGRGAGGPEHPARLGRCAAGRHRAKDAQLPAFGRGRHRVHGAFHQLAVDAPLDRLAHDRPAPRPARRGPEPLGACASRQDAGTGWAAVAGSHARYERLPHACHRHQSVPDVALRRGRGLLLVRERHHGRGAGARACPHDTNAPGPDPRAARAALRSRQHGPRARRALARHCR